MTHTTSSLLWAILAIAGCANVDASQTPVEKATPKEAEKAPEVAKPVETGGNEKKSTGKKSTGKPAKVTETNKSTEKPAAEPKPSNGEKVIKKPEPVVPPIRCKSAREVVDVVLDGLANGDWRRLNALRVDGKEYEEVLWPRFVAERKELERQKASFHFFLLETKSRAGIQDILSEFGRKKIEFVGFDHERVEDYQAFKLWRNVTVEFKVNGKFTRERLFGAIIERGGQFYLLSYPS